MHRLFRRTLVAGALGALLAFTTAPAMAQNFAGDTTGDPTFNRPVSLTSLSSTGTAVPYEVIPFHVTVPGDYVFTSISGNTAPENYDGYLLLYSNGFDAGDPLSNLLAGDDDFDPDGGGPLTSTGGSRISTTGGNSFGTPGALSSGVQYYLVQTGFNNTDFGAYTGLAEGPGAITFGFVPEPGSLSLLALGGLALLRRRR